jgi:V/A-type H+-transporting ATPase subunit I
MAIEKMRLIHLGCSKEDIDDILPTAFSTHDFHAELSSNMSEGTFGSDSILERDVFSQYLNRLDTVLRGLRLNIPYDFDKTITFTDKEIDERITQIELDYEKINAFYVKQSHLGNDDKTAIANISDELNDLSNRRPLANVHFGRLPIERLAKLPAPIENRFATSVVLKNKQYAWVMLSASDENKTELGKLLGNLNFESIALPGDEEKRLALNCETALEQIYGFVKYKAEFQKYYRYVTFFEDSCVIKGFVPQRRVANFKSLFENSPSVTMQDLPVNPDEMEPPTILRNNRFAKPFELFIELYGLPHYGEFDPTFYVAFTYSLLFGIMFGDLGQGLILVVLGWFLYRKTKGKLWGIVHRLGFFSMIFGTLYGSVFGNETVLNPLYHALGFAEKPIEVMRSEFTMPLLLFAVGLGAMLILTSMSINIFLQLRRKKIAEALFSQNGLAGVVFYGSLIGGAALQIGLKIPVANPVTIALFIVLPLLIILFRVPLRNFIQKMHIKPHEGWGGYMSESIFELLEVLLSFMSNTMSFLRVGGFVLSHAGMMVVVMKLTEMTGNFGIVTLIIGNVFVIGLEGLIVGIQTLRLEFYEMFSRYFEGGGKKFIPTIMQNLT